MCGTKLSFKKHPLGYKRTYCSTACKQRYWRIEDRWQRWQQSPNWEQVKNATGKEWHDFVAEEAQKYRAEQAEAKRNRTIYLGDAQLLSEADEINVRVQQ